MEVFPRLVGLKGEGVVAITLADRWPVPRWLVLAPPLCHVTPSWFPIGRFWSHLHSSFHVALFWNIPFIPFSFLGVRRQKADVATKLQTSFKVPPIVIIIFWNVKKEAKHRDKLRGVMIIIYQYDTRNHTGHTGRPTAWHWMSHDSLQLTTSAEEHL